MLILCKIALVIVLDARQDSTIQVRPFQVRPNDKRITLRKMRPKGKIQKTKPCSRFSRFPDGAHRETGFAALVGVGLNLGWGHTLTFHGMTQIKNSVKEKFDFS